MRDFLRPVKREEIVNKYQQTFSSSYPKAVDFADEDYQKDKDEADKAAEEYGYSLAGFRLGRAVFSTKKR